MASGMMKDPYLLYTKGNEIRYLDRNYSFADKPFITLENNDKVTFMAWAALSDYSQLVVGTEQGNIIIYSTPFGEELSPNPRVIKQFNVGGRVVSCKELNDYTSYKDKY